MEKGKIKFFKQEKGYGFILSDEGKDFFFHISDFINSEDYQNLNTDDEVEFEKGFGKDMRVKATQVKLIKN